MKRIIFILSIILFFSTSRHILATEEDCDWTFRNLNDKGKIAESPFFEGDKIEYHIKVKDTTPGTSYRVKSDCNLFDACTLDEVKTPTNGELIGTLPMLVNPMYPKNDFVIEVENKSISIKQVYCSQKIEFASKPTPTPSQRAECKLFLSSQPSNQFEDTSFLTISGKVGNIFGIDPSNAELSQIGRNIYEYPSIVVTGNTGSASFTPQIQPSFSFTASIGKFSDGNYKVGATVFLRDKSSSFSSSIPVTCSLDFTIPGGIPTPTPTSIPTPTPPDYCRDNDTECNQYPYDCSGRCKVCPQCQPTIKPTPKTKRTLKIPDLKPLCDQLSGEFSGKCWECQKTGGIWSAIGCLPTDFSTLIKDYVFKTGVGIAGGIAFLYFLYGAFLILTSSGNAEKMEEAKQIITSSLAGLLLIIFSIFLLQVIGVDILQIPGFTK